MKQSFSRILSILTILLILPSASHAFNNKAELTNLKGTTDLDYCWGSAENDEKATSIEYTRYLSSLETNDSPYAMREFLQHPSRFFIGYSDYAYTYKTDLFSGTFDVSGNVLRTGGIYYFKSGTGLGVVLFEENSKKTDRTYSPPFELDIDISNQMILLNHYISDNIMIGASYAWQSYQEKAYGNAFKFDSKSYGINAKALIDNAFWVSGTYEKTNHKFDSLGRVTGSSSKEIEVGFFPVKKFGFFLAHSDSNDEYPYYESSMIKSTLTGDFSLSDSIDLSLSIQSIKGEWKNKYGTIRDENGTYYIGRIGLLF